MESTKGVEEMKHIPETLHQQLIEILTACIPDSPGECDEVIAALRTLPDVTGEAVGVVANYGSNSGSLPPMPGIAWVNGIPPIGTNLYAAPTQSAVPLTPDQRVDICDACENLDYDDDFLCDVGKIIDLVEAAHGIGKEQQ
jgi:hypothetical protein